MSTRRNAITVLALAIALAGCGSSSSSSSSSTASMPATSTASGPPLSKTDYEAKLGPLLNQQVVPAMRAALANGGAANPARLASAIQSLQSGRDGMASVTPPADVADLHTQALQDLNAMIADFTKLRDAEQKNDSSAEQAAIPAIKADATKMQSLGSEFTSRGY